MWSTGKVLSNKQTHIPYAGQPLTSGQRVTWKVRAWDAEDKPSAFSTASSWEMGLLQAADWKGKWIGTIEQVATTTPPPLTCAGRSRSPDRSNRRARTLRVSATPSSMSTEKKISDRVLDPGFTRFDKRIIYVTHDVTSVLTQGNNAIGVVLGNGFLNVHANDVWSFDSPWRMPPRAIVQLQITYDDGTSETLVSDESWKVANGPITFDGIRNGETYDARLEKPGWSTAAYVEDGTWKTASVVRSAPGGVLSAQMFQPIKVVKTLRAAKIASPSSGVYVFDFKQNMAGWAKLSVSGAAGTQITWNPAKS